MKQAKLATPIARSSRRMARAALGAVRYTAEQAIARNQGILVPEALEQIPELQAIGVSA